MPDTSSSLPAEAPKRVLVTGSRTWTDHDVVRDALVKARWDASGPIVVVHGACPSGADAIAAWWCRQFDHLDIAQEPHPADWDSLGKRAGFARNAEMVALGADVCLAFIVDNSRGASHTADLAEKAGIPTRRYERTTRDV